jgi:hypothetical protein
MQNMQLRDSVLVHKGWKRDLRDPDVPVGLGREGHAVDRLGAYAPCTNVISL